MIRDEDYYLGDTIDKLEAVQRNLDAVPRVELLAVLNEAIARMRKISVLDDDKGVGAFVFQITVDGIPGDVAIGSGRNLVAALLDLGVSNEEAEETYNDVVSTLADDLVPVHRGSHFKVVAMRSLHG